MTAHSGFARRLRWALPAAALLMAFLFGAGKAQADTCEVNSGALGWHNPSTWSCGHVPTNADTAMINGATTDIGVSAAAQTGVLIMGDGGVITFSNDATLAAASMTVGTATVQGAGTLTVAGDFTKANSGGFNVKNQGGENSGLPSADLVLNGDATHQAGEICVAGNELVPGADRPNLEINATFTIQAGTGVNPFSCSTSATFGSNIHVAAGAELVKAGAGSKNSQSTIDNDGTLTVEAGDLTLIGGTGGDTSDGAYVAGDGAKLQFGSCCAENFQIGATGTIGGEGTVDLSANPMTMAAGSTIDPAVLNLEFGELTLNGTAQVDLPVLNLGDAILDSTRPVTVTTMNVTGGAIENDFTLTVPSTGTLHEDRIRHA